MIPSAVNVKYRFADWRIMSKKKQERLVKIVAIAIVVLFLGTAVAVAVAEMVS